MGNTIGFDKYLEKSVRIFFDDSTGKISKREGKLISHDLDFLFVRSLNVATHEEVKAAIPKNRVIRVEFLEATNDGD